MNGDAPTPDIDGIADAIRKFSEAMSHPDSTEHGKSRPGLDGKANRKARRARERAIKKTRIRAVVQ